MNGGDRSAMNAIELKEYIINNNKIEYIINNLNCHHLKEYRKEYRCGLPGHSSTNNIAIKKETLSVRIFKSDGKIIRGDIFTLVMDIKNISFFKSIQYLHNILNLKYTKSKNVNKNQEKIDPLYIFKKVKKRRYNVNDLEVYDESIIKDYTHLPHINWIREGILPFTCDKFKIGYSYDKKRIVIPHRLWCGDEKDYVGIIGRTTIPHFDILGIPKYFPIKAYPKSCNLYGLQENYKSIQRAGYCCVYESEKSVLKRYSRKDETGVAIGSHDLSDEQVKILIGLNVKIVIAFDKDISLQHIRYTCSRFYGIREVYYIYDKYDLLKEKESPADANNKIFNYLLKHKIRYNEREHQAYLKELEKERKY